MTSQPIRVIQWGCGSMGAGMMELVLRKQDLTLVGAVDRRPEVVGRDVGNVLNLGRATGVVVQADFENVMARTPAEIVLLATASFTRDVFDPLCAIIRKKLNVITIAEEMAAPHVKEPELARRLHELAMQHGVTVLGTGINPGFVLDSLILMLTGVCHEVRAIEASRINDLSPYGPTVMQSQGVGLTPAEFQQGVAAGRIVGHVGFQESVGLIAGKLGWKLDAVEEIREPIVSSVFRQTRYATVAPGRVAGCRHIARGLRGRAPVITLIHPQQILPQLEKVATGDYISIHGKPDLHLRLEPEIPGGLGTIGLAVNMIRPVVAASPGLKLMSDMPLPYCQPVREDAVS